MSDRKFIANFINGPTLEIKESISNNYNVKFIDQDNNKTHYETNLKSNHWASSSLEYLINWKIVVEDLNGNLIYEHLYNAENQRVFINFESKAIGDTLAWFPHVKKFQDKHKCQVIVSTFHNDFFKERYPELIFSDKGSVVNNLYAQYNIGWFYEKNDKIDYLKNPTNFRLQTLAKTCTSILGLVMNKEPMMNLPYVDRRERFVHVPGVNNPLDLHLNLQLKKAVVVSMKNPHLQPKRKQVLHHKMKHILRSF